MLLTEHIAANGERQSESETHSTHSPNGPGDLHTGFDGIMWVHWIESVQGLQVLLLLEHLASDAEGQSASVAHSTHISPPAEGLLHTCLLSGKCVH